MKKSIFISVITFAAAGFLLSGWERHLMTTSHFALADQQEVFSPDHAEVKVSVKAYTVSESQRYLKRDLIARQVQPVHVTLQNHTPRSFSICASSVDLPSITPKQAAFKVMLSALPRTIMYKIAGFFFWPFMIPGTIDGIRTFHTHRLLKQDFMAKSLKDEVLAPYSTFHRILFVPLDEFKEDFNVTIIDLETLEQVTLPASTISN